MSEFLVGIDLGTSNWAVAYIDPARARMPPFWSFPSCRPFGLPTCGRRRCFHRQFTSRIPTSFRRGLCPAVGSLAAADRWRIRALARRKGSIPPDHICEIVAFARRRRSDGCDSAVGRAAGCREDVAGRGVVASASPHPQRMEPRSPGSSAREPRGRHHRSRIV